MSIVELDMAEVRRLVAEHYIAARRHPEAPLTIYNYTAKAQYDRVWTPETLACRGFIVHDDGTVVARPFQKFFNLEEQPSLPDESFEVFEKVDGSLGISYWLDGRPFIATRGSFIGTQAQWASALLAERAPKLDPSITYLLEIVWHENRIVVDYGDYADLVLLAMIETANGREIEWWREAEPVQASFPTVRQWPDLAGVPLADLRQASDGANREGYVVRFTSGLRVKVKFEEYVRLHRLLTGLTDRHIWECLSSGETLDSLLDHVPDEFYQWVQDTAGGMAARYAEIEALCREQFRPLADRKETALYFRTCPYPEVLFAMLDGKPYAQRIWKHLRPATIATFRQDEV